MQLTLALTMSSKQEAEMFYPLRHPMDYRLSIRQTAEEIYQFAVQKVYYPDKKSGYGLGEPKYSDKYNIKDFDNWSALEKFLAERHIKIDAFDPVEDAEDNVSGS